MSSSSSILLGITAVVIAASNLSAQESVQLPSGARARLISLAIPPDEQVVSIVSAANDTVVFRPERNPIVRRLALSDINAIDISTGQRRKTLRGALFGLATGVAIGGTLGYVTYEACDDWCMFTPMSAGGNAMLGATAGGLVGLVAGTTSGFLIKSESWHRVRPGARIGVAPGRGGRSVAVSYAF
jgi:hypothetical protein